MINEFISSIEIFMIKHQKNIILPFPIPIRDKTIKIIPIIIKGIIIHCLVFKFMTKFLFYMLYKYIVV